MQNHLLIFHYFSKSAYYKAFQVVADEFLSATKFKSSATNLRTDNQWLEFHLVADKCILFLSTTR